MITASFWAQQPGVGHGKEQRGAETGIGEFIAVAFRDALDEAVQTEAARIVSEICRRSAGGSTWNELLAIRCSFGGKPVTLRTGNEFVPPPAEDSRLEAELCAEDVNCRHALQLDQTQFRSLPQQSEWVAQHQPVLPAGTAISRQAVQRVDGVASWHALTPPSPAASWTGWCNTPVAHGPWSDSVG